MEIFGNYGKFTFLCLLYKISIALIMTDFLKIFDNKICPFSKIRGLSHTIVLIVTTSWPITITKMQNAGRITYINLADIIQLQLWFI